MCLLIIDSQNKVVKSSKEEIRIEIIVKENNTEYWKKLELGARSYQGKLPITINVSGPDHEEDYATQIKYMEKAINRKPDAILLAAGDNTGLVNSTKRAKENGIPVFLIDSYIEQIDFISYIGSDNIEIGSNLAKEISNFKKDNIKIGIINFVKDAPAAMSREAAVIEYLENTDMEIVEPVYSDSDEERACMLTKKMLEEYAEINVLIGLNAQSTIGAGWALEELNRQDIILGGVDLTMEQVKLLENNILDFSIVQNSFLIGYLGVEQAVHYIENNLIPEDKIINTKLINLENLYEKENQQLIFSF